MRFLMFTLVFLMLQIVFNVCWVMFDKRPCCFVAPAFDYSLRIMFVSFHMVLRETSMLLFVIRITFFLIWVFRELHRYGLVRVIN